MKTQELVEKFLSTIEISFNEPLSPLYEVTYTYGQVLCAWVNAEHAPRSEGTAQEAAAKILKMKNGKQLSNFLQNRKFQKNIGKTVHRKYNSFMAQTLGMSYCDSCKDYLPVESFPIIIRKAYKNSNDDIEYRNLCTEHFNKYMRELDVPSKTKGARNAYQAKRRALKVSTTNPEEENEIQKFYKECPEGHQVDHKTPLSRGGTHTLDNLQYMLSLSNNTKSSRTNEEWIKYCEEKGLKTGIHEKNSS